MLCVIDSLILFAYAVLFVRFLVLFREQRLEKIRKQVTTFFVIMIVLLAFRVTFHWVFFSIINRVLITTLYQDHNVKTLAVLNTAQLIILICEAAFNIGVVYFLAQHTKIEQRAIEREAKQSLLVEKRNTEARRQTENGRKRETVVSLQ